jgi:acetyltransferase
MTRHRLSPLLDPRSVALYGASEREGATGRRLLESLVAAGFEGPLGLVNPKRTSAFGRPCVRRAAELDFVPEVAIAAVPARVLPDVVADCGERGTRFLVVFAPDGAGRGGTHDGERALLAAARAAGVRVLGPHCMALMRPASGLAAGFVPAAAKPGRLALLSQSGAIAASVIDWAAATGIGFSSVVSLGGALDLDFGELLDWYLYDHRTDGVLLYLEGVRDARGFLSSLRALSRVKPVVVWKAGGRDGVDADATPGAGASHADVLTGSDRVFDAAIARAGAVRAHTTMQLLAVARLLALRKRPAGPRVAVVSNGGGPGVVATDAIARQRLELAALSDATVAALDAALPSHGSHRNPVNLLTDADPARIEAALRAVLADEGTDAALMLLVPQTATSAEAAAQAIVRAAAGQHKPVTAVLAGGASVREGQSRLEAAEIPHFLTPENAVDALALLEGFATHQQKLRQVPTAIDEGFAPDVAAAEAIYRAAIAQGRTLLDEVESKALLAAFGIDAPPSIVATTAAQAAQAAAKLGFPVVLKVLSPDIVHKSDVGGVRINVQSQAAARAAAEDILESVARLRPEARVSGVVVQPMVRTRHQREVYVGMATDPVFGAVIAFGAGGVAVEQIDDLTIGLPPLNSTLARALIGGIRFARLLRAYRTVPSIDFGRLEQTLVRFSTLVCECPWLSTVDVNPLVVDEDRATALDARIRVTPPDDLPKAHWRGAYGHLAIHPYPRELEETLGLRNGTTVRLRPIRPEDADLERAFVAALSPEALYRRFMMPVKELSPQMIERFTQIDYDRELALVALHDPSGGTPGGPGSRIVGVARIIPTWDEASAEFAIVVGDWMQHSGLGRELMLRLFDACRVRGYTTIEGIVLGENVSMLRFCEKLGFTITVNPDDPAERIVRRPTG